LGILGKMISGSSGGGRRERRKVYPKLMHSVNEEDAERDRAILV
jgi:hypothetical protein